jgi:hypothetical protein
MAPKGLILFFIFIIATNAGKAAFDDDLYLFGSLQTIGMYNNFELHAVDKNSDFDTLMHSHDQATYAVQQLDIFLNNQIGDNLNVFVDLEFTMNYSSEKGWGNLNLQEAWLNYYASDYLNIKVGWLFPKFNNMNEIKNRLTMLPYIFRPIVYEQIFTYENFYEDFVPEHAFLQLSGFYPIGNLRLDYAAYTGNSESSYITNKESADSAKYQLLTGVDTQGIGFKLFGGRIGARKDDESFKTGISVTYDHDNKRSPGEDLFGRRLPPMGDVPRIRLGYDISFNLWDLYFEGEMIHIFYDYPKSKMKRVEMGQEFYHAMGMYNITEDLFVYGSFEMLRDEYTLDKSDFYSAGAGYRFNSSVTAKFQYVYYEQEVDAENLIPLYFVNTIDFVLLGVSVMF